MRAIESCVFSSRMRHDAYPVKYSRILRHERYPSATLRNSNFSIMHLNAYLIIALAIVYSRGESTS